MILICFEHILRQDVRNEFVVNAYPRLARLLGHVPVRMKNVECVVTTRCRQTVVIENCRRVVNQLTPITDSLSDSPPKSLYLTFCDCLRPGEIKPG